MITDNLIQFGFPPRIVQSWKRSGIKNLSRIQQMALNSGRLFDSNMLILAPTSSGKTFCGEMACTKAASSGKKAVFLVPLRAIASEKAANFREKYEPFGLRIALSTRDDRDDDRAIMRGDFEIAIVIYEKFNRFLARNINLLSVIDTIVFDEVDILHQLERGMVGRLILSKSAASSAGTKIIGLGRIDFSAGDLPMFDSGILIRDNHRPVDLRKGIVYNGEFRYQDHNSMNVSSEFLLEATQSDDRHSSGSGLKEALIYFAAENEQTLVFLKSKSAVVNAALEYSSLLEFGQAKDAIGALENFESSANARLLKACLANGIAFHNADLTEHESRAVIDGYRRGEIRVLFSTTTLAAGVNLPAKNVLIEPVQFAGEDNGSRPMETLMDYSDVDTISGRAGRLGADMDFGRAVLFARNDFENETLWQRFIEGTAPGVNTRVFPLTQEILTDIIASGICPAVKALRLLLGKICAFDNEHLTELISELESAGIIQLKDNILTATTLGKQCAISGLRVSTVVTIAVEFAGLEDFELGHCLGALRDCWEIAELKMPPWFYYRLRQGALWSDGYEEHQNPVTVNEVRAKYLSRLLADWVSGERLSTLEENYHASAGLIDDYARRVSWVFYSAGDILKSLGEKNPGTALEKIASRVRYGLPVDGLKLAKASLPKLTRSLIMLLNSRSVFTVKDLANMNKSDYPDAVKRELMEEIILECREYLKSKESNNHSGLMKSGETAIRKLRFTEEKNKGNIKVVINGIPAVITYKSYHYLKRLATALLNGERHGWVHRLDLDDGDNQWSYLYRLRKEVKKVLPESGEIIENDRQGNYRLLAQPEGIEMEGG
ncbi:MAG: DEAD/DEAH box helicase [candidate division Zixibacteria bacterium]|nr:DEAD/DEAH box helicase [candidate division Zixibacteria bacterium]